MSNYFPSRRRGKKSELPHVPRGEEWVAKAPNELREGEPIKASKVLPAAFFYIVANFVPAQHTKAV
eukprot:scaffold33991_cov25-Prasinocladus_malaysianus.AAC.1